jgi:hypothetical protein
MSIRQVANAPEQWLVIERQSPLPLTDPGRPIRVVIASRKPCERRSADFDVLCAQPERQGKLDQRSTRP